MNYLSHIRFWAKLKLVSAAANQIEHLIKGEYVGGTVHWNIIDANELHKFHHHLLQSPSLCATAGSYTPLNRLAVCGGDEWRAAAQHLEEKSNIKFLSCRPNFWFAPFGPFCLSALLLLLLLVLMQVQNLSHLSSFPWPTRLHHPHRGITFLARHRARHSPHIHVSNATSSYRLYERMFAHCTNWNSTVVVQLLPLKL